MIAASARKRLHDRRDAVSEILISCRFLDHRRIAQRGRDDMRGAPVERASHTRALLDSGSLAPRRRRQDSLFFSCAVVISVQCSSIRDCTASPVSSWLGGQNGEEVKVEDEIRCEEDRTQDREAAEEGEEVTPRRREPLR